ncbi:MAG: copper resistance protein CopC [Micrococcus sp.]|nr:copper resistance protein CopC [Micrococcus sp.]
MNTPVPPLHPTLPTNPPAARSTTPPTARSASRPAGPGAARPAAVAAEGLTAAGSAPVPAEGPAGTRPAGRRRTLRRGLGGATAAALLALSAATVTAAPALAHDQLLSTTPEAGSTVTTAPAEVSLTFSGDLITGQGIQNLVTVTDGAGHQWQDGDAQVSGPGLTSALCEGMPNGDYEVDYRVVYSDGHSEAKNYGFTLDDQAAPETGAPQDCGVPNQDAPVSSGEGPTSAGAASSAGATGGVAPAGPGDDDGAGTGGTEGATSGAEPAPATLDTPAPIATDQGSDQGGDPGQTEATSQADRAGMPAWVWVAGIVGVVIVAAAVVFVFRRARAIDHPAGGRPDPED